MVVFEIQNLNGITVGFLLPRPFFFLKYVFMAWSFPFHATMHDVRQITICSITHHHYFASVHSTQGFKFVHLTACVLLCLQPGVRMKKKPLYSSELLNRFSCNGSIPSVFRATALLRRFFFACVVSFFTLFFFETTSITSSWILATSRPPLHQLCRLNYSRH